MGDLDKELENAIMLYNDYNTPEELDEGTTSYCIYLKYAALTKKSIDDKMCLGDENPVCVASVLALGLAYMDTFLLNISLDSTYEQLYFMRSSLYEDFEVAVLGEDYGALVYLIPVILDFLHMICWGESIIDFDDVKALDNILVYYKKKLLSGDI